MVCESWVGHERWLLSTVFQGSAYLTGKKQKSEVLTFKMKAVVLAVVFLCMLHQNAFSFALTLF